MQQDKSKYTFQSYVLNEQTNLFTKPEYSSELSQSLAHPYSMYLGSSKY